MANKNLGDAKKAKNDEFYTQLDDIQKEMNAYLEYDPDVFRGKTILLPCDDPEWSNFTRFFAQNFEAFGLKKLISTSYAVESKNFKADWQPSLFEEENPKFDADKTRIKGKIFVLDRDTNGDKKIDIDDLEWDYLEGDGDFRSGEVRRLRDEADVIITNPPFSLFREFVAWIMEAEKRFAIIGNMNAITYKEVFPLLMENKIWLGTKDVRWFYYGAANGDLYEAAHSRWLTNIEHGRRHQPLSLMTMADNIKFSRHKEIRGTGYQKYDNYDAIEVPFTDAIPSDYAGAMGVPISFLDKHCPEQFDIIGASESEGKGFSNGLLHEDSKTTQPMTGGGKTIQENLHHAQGYQDLTSTTGHTLAEGACISESSSGSGVMGVPISFLDKYCPEQFEIVGITKTWFGGASKVYPAQIQVDRNGKRTEVTKLNDGAVLELAEPPAGETYYEVGGKFYIQVYARILIRFRR